MDKIKLCNGPESNRAEIRPSELATKCRGKSKKGVSVCPVTLYKVVLGVVLHVLSYYVAVSACAAAHVVGCCMRGAAACVVLYVVHYYVTVTLLTMSCARLGMLLQIRCCIQDAAAAKMAASPKFLEAKSRGLVDLFLLFSFPKGELKRFFFFLFGLD